MEHHEPNQPRSTDDAAVRHRDGALLIRHCLTCGLRLAPMIVTCTGCRSTALEWVISSGEGSIVSWKVVHRPRNHADSDEWETSTMAIIELDDGPWMYTTIDGEVPAPSEGPVRVQFTPDAARDRFPVFTIRSTDPAVPDEPDEPPIRHTDVRKGNTPMTEMTGERPCDPIWVRSCLHQCDFLAKSRSLDADAKALIRFAIQWAPFGGASADELLVNFGITRWRFVQVIRENLRPRAGDSRTARTFKRNLLDALSLGWQIFPDSATALP
ncbi:Zn-ribbon domain-containing OB-fold protein [Nocardia jiangxiensis]|uniref:Zn-ribbon domain-containing OB-fold protein n=1 Tax=Nocardia jiangxiensis TaxID=282685 RepID=UPI001FDEFB8A|nr:OB-fold domain-containing protein [Nocardia jiangxiensis]